MSVTQCQAFEIKKSDMVPPLSWLLESGEPMLYTSGNESWGNDQYDIVYHKTIEY